MWISTQGTDKSWKVLSAWKSLIWSPWGSDSARERPIQNSQKSRKKSVLYTRVLGNHWIERVTTKPGAYLLSVIIISRHFSMANYTVPPLQREKTKILKQDSFKGVMAVCERVDNSESFLVCINQKTKLPITTGKSHCITSWIQRKKAQSLLVVVKARRQIQLKSGSGKQKQRSRSQMSEGDEVTLWAWRKERIRLARIKHKQCSGRVGAAQASHQIAWISWVCGQKLGPSAPFHLNLIVMWPWKHARCPFPFLHHHFRAGLFYWFIHVKAFIQHQLFATLCGRERASNWEDSVLHLRTWLSRGMEMLK